MDNCQLKIYTFVGWVIFVHPLPVNGAKPDVRHVNHRRRTHVLYVICSTVTLYSHYSPEVDDIFSKKSQNPRHLKMSGWQILAFLGGLVGLGTTIGATVSNEWKATSRASSVITATWVLQGLWNNCAGNAIGALHCRPHHTIFKLEGKEAAATSSTITMLYAVAVKGDPISYIPMVSCNTPKYMCTEPLFMLLTTNPFGVPLYGSQSHPKKINISKQKISILVYNNKDIARRLQCFHFLSTRRI